MTQESAARTESELLSAIGEATLLPVVRRALNQAEFDLGNWSHSRVHGGAGDVGNVLSSVYRFAGEGRARDATVEWSLILKIVGTSAPNDDPAEGRYWKREVLAHESGHLADLPGGLAAPRFLGTLPFSEKVAGPSSAPGRSAWNWRLS